MFKSATYGGRDVSETPIELVNEDVHVVLTYTDRWTGLAGTVNTTDGGADDADACSRERLALCVQHHPADLAQGGGIDAQLDDSSLPVGQRSDGPSVLRRSMR